MRAELVAVGDELTSGDQVDTNSGWLADRLSGIGVDVLRHTTVGDDPEAISEIVRDAVERADVVVLCGGLGPTHDDRTRYALAAAAGLDLERRDELVAHIEGVFTRMGRTMPERNLVQADLPAGARIVAPAGTAAGFCVEFDGVPVYCLPGVPDELRTMVDRDVVPDLQARGDLHATVSRLVRTAGVSESSVAERLAPVIDRLEESEKTMVAFLPSGGETRVKVVARGATPDAAAAAAEPVVAEIVDRLGSCVVGVDEEGTAHAIARQLDQLGWTLAIAESVTGGHVGERLVAVPGASDWFAGGLLVYTTAAKQTLAGVDPALLASHGPVSEACAAALARGTRERLGADVALAVVGVAGPDTQGGQAVGTICLAVTLPDGGAQTRTVQVPPRGRVEVQRFAASAALDYLRRRLATAWTAGVTTAVVTDREGQGERLRLFVAVDVPDAVRSAAADALAPLREGVGAASVRWTESASWHLTLAFLGWTDPQDVPVIEEACAAAAAAQGRFRIALDGRAGTFGQRVLWLGLTDATELVALADEVRAALARAGVACDERPFRAHLTVARARRGAKLPRGLAERYQGPTLGWTVGRLLLRRSHLARTGATHETLGAWPLR